MFIGNIVDFKLPKQLQDFDESLYIDETEGLMDYKLLADIRRGKLDQELDALIHCQENSEYRNKSVIKAAKLKVFGKIQLRAGLVYQNQFAKRRHRAAISRLFKHVSRSLEVKTIKSI